MSNEHSIDHLVRVIDPDKFSAQAHGPGHRIVLADDKARLFEATFLGRLFGHRGETQYYVKTLSVAKPVQSWLFHWSEGTNAISLDFGSSFVLQANDELQAVRLVQALRNGASGEALFGLINAQLHRELETMLRECDSKALNLLDCFLSSSIGIGESEQLNRRVSEGVAAALGGAAFRIGFQLKNSPPMQIEVKREDEFTLADSTRRHKAETTALLHLDNYQAYKKSGLESEAAVRETIGRAITQAVKQLLFAQKYYRVVRSFTQAADSIENKMRERIRDEARTIGYRVDMFQTYPDIAALKLLDPMRIDVAADDQKYMLAGAAGQVQVSVALSVKVSEDFDRLHLLIEPAEVDVARPIVQRVKRLCADTIQRFGRMEFNLNFDETVLPAITRAIVDGLNAYGLKTEVVHIVPAPSEDAKRFMAIRGRTIDFSATIEARANAGGSDAVQMRGKVEVTGMAEQGWERFEAKDFGYRQDSHLTEARMRQLAGSFTLPLSATTPMPSDERRLLAIDLELAEIGDRVTSVIRESLSTTQDLAAHWRSLKGSEAILARCQQLAQEAVAQEFGLSISLRSARREATQGELVNTGRLNTQYQILADQAGYEVGHQTRVREQLDAADLQLLESAARKEREALDDESSAQYAQAQQRAAGLAQAVKPVQRLTGDLALRVLPMPPQTQAPQGRLPWEPEVPPAAITSTRGKKAGKPSS